MKLAYTLSSELNAQITTIDAIRRRILLAPIPARTELRLRWDAMISRIHHAVSLEQENVSKKTIVDVITTQGRIKDKKMNKSILGYKRAFDSIRENWLLNQKSISSRHILDIAEASGVTFSRTVFNPLRDALDNILTYLQSHDDHPLIQAALAQSKMREIGPFEENTEWIGRLSSYLFLYKYGLDFRGLLVLEEGWAIDKVMYKKALESVKTDINVNRWLFYFISSMAGSLENIVDQLIKPGFLSEAPPSFFALNDRQKEILSMLDQPGIIMTNRKAQKMCKISQITASRDLARLASLGLIFPYGKGRSTYYTKA